jgi:hypothetical protein
MSSSTLRLSAFAVAALLLATSGCGQHDPDDKTNHLKNGTTKPAATQPATKPAAAATDRELFDGKSLKGWKKSGFAGEGEAEVKDGLIVIPAGEALSGITFEGGDLPTMNYELTVVAKKVEGSDFFCGITFPVNKTHASMICGGWGGGLVGISSIDDNDASENGTSQFKKFEVDKWYTMRIRVMPDRLQTWIDDEQMADVDTKGKKIDIRAGIEDACPLGISTFRTTGAVKSVKIKKL